jgi:AraC family transcriptional regulator of adaptative response/methylated-DNA-[protein]-cysteine methyltransferase
MARTTHTDEHDPRWRAVAARDVRFDESFVFAVLTTRIYCRPSCPARRPRRDRVVFFDSPEAAERAGFRPCRRCRPWELGGRRADLDLVERACRALGTEGDGPTDLDTVADRVGTSIYRLRRAFQRVLAVTPRQYLESQRIADLKSRLRDGASVTAALYDAGYGSASRLYERVPRLGMTPGTYRQGGQGMRIAYTFFDSPVGRVLVAATDRGICAITLGTSDAGLERALREEYPAADIRRNDARLRPLVQHLLDHIAGRLPDLDLPLDIVATAFQSKVWESMCAIPYGQTRSYKEIAQAIGQPKAARAVARACATTPVALAIPCHRVVREDGHIGGYRWGVRRKKALLARERLATGK